MAWCLTFLTEWTVKVQSTALAGCRDSYKWWMIAGQNSFLIMRPVLIQVPFDTPTWQSFAHQLLPIFSTVCEDRCGGTIVSLWSILWIKNSSNWEKLVVRLLIWTGTTSILSLMMRQWILKMSKRSFFFMARPTILLWKSVLLLKERYLPCYLGCRPCENRANRPSSLLCSGQCAAEICECYPIRVVPGGAPQLWSLELCKP